jgi:hypothetical protein
MPSKILTANLGPAFQELTLGPDDKLAIPMHEGWSRVDMIFYAESIANSLGIAPNRVIPMCVPWPVVIKGIQPQSPQRIIPPDLP